ncbi:transcription elongation factor A N-terminal and central domain-containing protein 2 [Hydra vulgaris]|uniref:transcription elongation factor A N-terminal and central domain-containing protein 2 n=1 Tax=Hydra vulgaris TaxID=6087 RepID=UPI00019276A5|nr:transcription elongation factor A N-terminal and central domain-containing protein 2 [Hydra vulgaris]
MDKYVIKIPRDPSEGQTPVIKKVTPKFRQTTIESLKRVVVVEEMIHVKNILSMPEQTIDQLVSCLTNLENRIPSKEVLLETKLGHVINKLRKHEAEEVQQLAQKVLQKWKQFYKNINARQPIEVKSDKKTFLFRAKAKSLIASGLKTELNNSLVDVIEGTVYLTTGRSLQSDYRKAIRTLHFHLKNNKEIREDVLNKRISPQQICKKLNVKV